jgi:leucyl-tRNA synthetase
MLPYPSGTLHIGHIRNYSIGDALARYKWMRGFNVLHPMGWDAFGLPAENAAIANKRPPREWTLRQHRGHEAHPPPLRLQLRLGPRSLHLRAGILSLEPVVLPAMLERGLAYRKQALVNWCPKCATVLANEQVVDGCCWRHEDHARGAARAGTVVPAHTAYADELLRDIAQLEGGWPERVLTMQRNWIGRRKARKSISPGEGYGPNPRFHHARRHHLRRHLRDPGAGASAVARNSMRRAGARQAMVDARANAGPRRYREGRLRHRPLRHQSVQRRKGSRCGSATSS